MMHSKPLRIFLPLAVLALVLVAAGCGGDNKSKSS